MISVAWGHRLLLLLPFLLTAVLWGWTALDNRAAGVSRPPGFFARNGWPVGIYLLLAAGVWLVVLVALPQLSMIDMSFRHKLPINQIGGPRDTYTLENYRYFLFGSTTSTSSWNVVHLRAFAMTIISSLLITALNFIICYPIAYYLARIARGAQLRLLLVLLIAPFWVNDILRAFAFRIVFSEKGLINTALLGVGWIAQPIDFIGFNIALFAGLIYAYTLMMVFPLYNALDSVEAAQIEAARDLGAPWWHIHLFIVMPAAKAGIASGCTLVFMLATGALAAPLVLGGPSTLWFTPIVYDRFYQVFNWPQGAAYAFVLLAGCIALVITALRLLRLSLADIAR